jgi:hypothetical protein
VSCRELIRLTGGEYERVREDGATFVIVPGHSSEGNVVEEHCAERLEVRAQDYERVRGDSRLYVITKGHEIPDVEQVVEHAEGYDVVRKDEGAPAELSRELDPRS